MQIIYLCWRILHKKFILNLSKNLSPKSSATKYFLEGKDKVNLTIMIKRDLQL